MLFSADELARATNSYSRSNLIGKGGFGKVYKGTLRKCMTVAIKVLTQVRPAILIIIGKGVFPVNNAATYYFTIYGHCIFPLKQL